MVDREEGFLKVGEEEEVVFDNQYRVVTLTIYRGIENVSVFVCCDNANCFCSTS